MRQRFAFGFGLTLVTAVVFNILNLEQHQFISPRFYDIVRGYGVPFPWITAGGFQGIWEIEWLAALESTIAVMAVAALAGLATARYMRP